MPSRRDALRACGAALTLSVAGCLSSDIDRTGTDGSVDDSTTDPTTSPSPPEAREVSVGSVERGVPMALPDVRWPDEPFRAFTVGEASSDSDDASHTLWVGNATDEARTVEFALTTSETTLLEESVEFESGTVFVVELREPRAYEMVGRSGGLETTVEVDRSRIDCNQSATDVAVTKDGMETASVTTDMACGTTTV